MRKVTDTYFLKTEVPDNADFSSPIHKPSHQMAQVGTHGIDWTQWQDFVLSYPTDLWGPGSVLWGGEGE